MTAIHVSILPALILGLFGGLALLVAMLFSIRASQIVIGGMLFLAGISVIIDYFKHIYQTWLLPIQAYRTHLFGVLGIVLLVGFLPRMKYLSLGKVSGHAWLFMIMGLYAGVLRFYHVSGEDGLLSIGFVLVTIAPLALVLPAIIRDHSDCEKMIRVIVLATLVWVGAVFVQFVLNRKLVVLGSGNRFTGLIANCNQAATMLSVVSVCSVWMAFNRRQVQRLFYTAVTGIFLLLLIWTGSRGGMGMFLIGATAVLYRRFGQTVLLLPLVAIALVVMLKVAEAANIKLGAERLMDTTNTRAAPWSSLLKSGLSSPIFGVGPESVEGSENSYLLAFASYGFGMVILMFLLVGISALQCLRLYRVRRSVDPATGSLIDLVLGQQAIYFLGSVFEGYVNARVGSNLVILLIFAAIGKYLLAYTSGRAAVEGGDAVEYAPIQEGDASPSLVGAA